MKRRDALTAFTLIAGAARPKAFAQRVPRIGVVGDQNASEPRLEGLRQGLAALGYKDGGNIRIEYRYLGGFAERGPGAIAELLKLGLDVLVVGGEAVALAAQQQTRAVPIVFANAADPVRSGLAATLSRPGGNATGQATLMVELVPKQIELLREIVPGLAKVGLLHASGVTASLAQGDVLRLAPKLGISVQPFETPNRTRWPETFARLSAANVGAVAVISHPSFGSDLPELARLSLSHRLPTMYNRREFAQAGGLISYGANFTEAFRRAATQVDKILRGARPGDLPVEQPAKFDLAINRRTAQIMGLTIPQALVLRADEVIE